MVVRKEASLVLVCLLQPFLGSPTSSVASLQEWEEPTGGWFWHVHVNARILRDKTELTTSFIFKYSMDIRGELAEDWSIKGSAIKLGDTYLILV